ncbi:MAG: hypothetical protein HY331_04330 [Chloroflexi bacterium]|nr:hypothetical protein [Chloroflexota bacterium]
MRADQTLRLAAALLPVIAAFALGVYGLAAPSVRGDEAFSFHLASQRLPEILASLRASEIHPPLYYVMLHLWLRAVGSTDFALRYLSVIFFVPLAALVYRIVEDSVAGIQRDEAAFGEPGAEAPTTNPSVQRGPNPFNPLPESVDS